MDAVCARTTERTQLGRYAMAERAGHDASLAFVGEGKIFHFERERFTGRRHDDGSLQPWRQACFANAGITWADIAIVVGCSVYTTVWPDAHRCSRKNNWAGETIDIDQIFVGGEITHQDENSNQKVVKPLCHISHHFAHASYAFFTSPYEEVSVMTMDGGGDACVIPETGEVIVSAASTGTIRQGIGESSCTYHVKHPRDPKNSVGAGWSGLSIELTGRVNQDGTVMALGGSTTEHPLKTSIRQLQEDTNRMFVKHITGLPSLPTVLGGGCALNGIATYNLLQSGVAKKIFVPPSVNDGGLTVGEALFALHHVLGVPRCLYAPGTVAFSGWDPGVGMLSSVTADKIAELVSQGHLVGVFQGRAESGPRALGHRSILGDPTKTEMKDRINKAKGRQSYRPVAPAMTKDFAKEHFKLIDEEAYYFMTCICKAGESAKALIPAAIHEDGSARIQILVPQAGLDDVITGLVQRGRPACVLNTSFNGPGQAIVHTPDMAIQTGRKLGLHSVVIGDTMEKL